MSAPELGAGTATRAKLFRGSTDNQGIAAIANMPAGHYYYDIVSPFHVVITDPTVDDTGRIEIPCQPQTVTAEEVGIASIRVVGDTLIDHRFVSSRHDELTDTGILENCRRLERPLRGKWSDSVLHVFVPEAGVLTRSVRIPIDLYLKNAGHVSAIMDSVPLREFAEPVPFQCDSLGPPRTSRVSLAFVQPDGKAESRPYTAFVLKALNPSYKGKVFGPLPGLVYHLPPGDYVVSPSAGDDFEATRFTTVIAPQDTEVTIHFRERLVLCKFTRRFEAGVDIGPVPLIVSVKDRPRRFLPGDSADAVWLPHGATGTVEAFGNLRAGNADFRVVEDGDGALEIPCPVRVGL